MRLNKLQWTYIYVLLIILSIVLLYFYIFNQTYTFPPTLLINLDSRKDRLKEFNDEFNDWPVPIERVSAVKYSPGWKGCSASHLKCLQLAKDRNYPWVLLLEDDCTLIPNAAIQFKALLPYLWKNKENWDLFYGGTALQKYQKRISYEPPVYEVSGLYTHFCLINKSAYNKILNDYPKTISEYTEPIDVFYRDNFRIWTTTPFFAKQRASNSDIEPGLKNYSNDFLKTEKELLELQ
jgi:hypothetical protein